MRKYYLITDLENNVDYLYWEYVGTDILGAVIGFAKKQASKIENLRVYEFKTKKQWNDYGTANFYRIALWRSCR